MQRLGWHRLAKVQTTCMCGKQWPRSLAASSHMIDYMQGGCDVAAMAMTFCNRVT